MARYEFSQGTSSKFWEITRDGGTVTTTYGKIGTAGRSTSKTYPSLAQAEQQVEKQAAAKLKKGYQPAGETVTTTYGKIGERREIDHSGEYRYVMVGE